MKKILLALFVMLAMVSCRKDETHVANGNDTLIGSWINPQYTDTLVVYSRAVNLIENEIGFTFQARDKFIYRQNSGWCGTPPITTADYDGTWTRNDSIINITVGYWGGTVEYTWKIIKLDDQELVIAVVKLSFSQGK